MSKDKNNEILTIRIVGNVSLNDIIKHYILNTRKKDSPEIQKVLLDCRDAKFNITPEEITHEHHCRITMTSSRKTKFLKKAIVVDKPHETAIAQLLVIAITSKLENYLMKVFSTEKAAQNWLRVSTS